MSRGAGRVLTGIGLALALVMIAGGTATLVSLWWLRSETIHQTVAAAASVRVYSDCGSVTVDGAPRQDIGLSGTIWWTYTRPAVTTTVVDGVQVVQVACDAVTFGAGSSADITVEVPVTTDVSVRASAGSVTVSGLAGTVDAKSDAGAVEGSQLRAGEVQASSSAGAVRLSFAAAPSAVQAHSSAGSVTVLLPEGPEAYHVVATSSAASSDVRVKTDPSSPRTVEATSSGGSVVVDYLG